MIKAKQIWWSACIAAAAVLLATAWWWLTRETTVRATMEHTEVQTESGNTLEIVPDRNAPAAGMGLVAETDRLNMYFDEQTTAIAITDKHSGHTWWSNPPDREDDPLAAPYEKEVLSSQLSLTFRDRFTNRYTFINFADSVENGQFTTESIENGVRVIYTIGQTASAIDALPKYIHRQRLEERVLNQLSEADARYVQARYYPLKDEPEVMERLDDVVAKPLVLSKMLDAFTRAGYTEDDLAYDNDQYGIAATGEDERPYFVVPLEYRLDDDELVVTVPAAQIEEAEQYRIHTLDMLMFFGAADTDSKGYTFVPDGSGSLIHHNNGKTTSEMYSQPVYGSNETRDTSRRWQITESIRLPVFGLTTGEAAWLAHIEEGSGLAVIRADVSGRRHAYNHAYARFNVREEDEITFATANRMEDIPVMSEELYAGNLTVRYSFMYGEQANYSGMAAHYRTKLHESGQLMRKSEEQPLPFYVDIVGAITKRKFLLGVPYEGTEAATTFAQAEDIYDHLLDHDVYNVRMRYLGWFNSGIYHSAPDRIRLERILGSNTEMQALAKKLEQSGGQLYPDTAFQHVNRNSIRFFPAREASRYLTRSMAWRTHFNRARDRMQIMRGDYYLLSPSRLGHYTEQFTQKYARFGLPSLSLRDLGDRLHSDWNPRREVSREQALAIVTAELARLGEVYPQLLVSGGNVYALPFADHLVDVPESSSHFNITDEDVPFYQMVIHGSLDYAGKPLNLHDQQDTELALLKMAEYGMAPRFAWSYAPSSTFKSTKFDHYYAAHYEDWLEEAVRMYDRLERVFNGVRSEPIVRHEYVRTGVSKTTYESGVYVIVNYHDDPVTVEGITVQGRDFARGGEPK